MKLEDVMKALDPIAKGLGVAVGEIWSIYVKQWLVKGASQLLTAILIGIAGYFAFIYGMSNWKWYIGIPCVLISITFLYSSIPLVFNPKYEALNELVDKVKEFKN